MKLVVGLGNPGQKYSQTKHNLGFVLLDNFAQVHNLTFSLNKKLAGYVASSPDYILLKPTTFVNLSGQAVSKAIKYFGIQLASVLVIHDDVDLKPKSYKLAYGASSGGHHGVEDIIEKLNSPNFYRLRIGVGRPATNAFDVETYVLSAIDSDYEPFLQTVLVELEAWLSKP